MKIATLLLAWVLILTPATTLAQQQESQIYRLNIPSEQKPEPDVRFKLRLNQQVRQWNADIEYRLEEAREIKQFSEPYINEFQRRNERIQQRPEAGIENILPAVR
ncbi:hypothetical protein WA1_19415 [Scytonema hofmannii PCC 7110]|uniref:Uncharacterized protein n=1 Tax=Scytonema hofmannii PCC 7110 TaxID=128403 RepID=A0A139XBT7_9CYAN|nr:hypothetical protein [Scytonema hofmannii]KYC42160.1 hypothetical protein WA1_19415 [Scytonema hofmannii PCC 7110]